MGASVEFTADSFDTVVEFIVDVALLIDEEFATSEDSLLGFEVTALDEVGAELERLAELSVEVCD